MRFDHRAVPIVLAAVTVDVIGFGIIMPVLPALITRLGHLDLAAFKQHKEKCRVHRFWAGETTQAGSLLHLGHDRWVFSYEPGTEDDEPAFHFDRHQFVPGEYVSITEHDGVTRPFRIVSVR